MPYRIKYSSKEKIIWLLSNASRSVLKQMVVHSLTLPHTVFKLFSSVPKVSLLKVSISLTKGLILLFTVCIQVVVCDTSVG